MTNARSAKSAREKAADMRAETERAAARTRAAIAGFIVLAVILLAWGGYALYAKAQETEAAKAAPPANLYLGTNTIAGGLLVGSASAKVTVDIYEDFICPICKTFNEAIAPMLKKYTDAGQVAVVYRPVSILDGYSSTEYSTRAANALAVVLNSKPDSAIAFQEELFTNQPPENGPGLPDSTLVELAVKAGADRATVEPDIINRRFEGWVTSTANKFTKAFPPGGTPTVAVNGKRVENIDPANLASVIEAEVKK